MAIDVVMPRLSDSMAEGTVVEWLKRVGDPVAAGEPLVEIDTDKALLTYESDAAGVLLEIRVREGETVPIGRVIARIGPPDEQSDAEGGSADQATVPRGTVERSVDASPPARRLAAEHGLDLVTLTGTGPGGRITEADVRQAVGAGTTPETGQAALVGGVTVHPLSPVQRTVARRMSEAKSAIPHFYLTLDVEMDRVVELRATSRAADPAKRVPSITDVIVKAVARALREHPRVNGSFRGDRLEAFGRVNVGIAVAAGEALLVPTIFDADRKSLDEVAADTSRLAEKVRDRTIRPEELDGGTFTVSNLGMYGIDAVVPVINPPQAAILGVGAVQMRARVTPEAEVRARQCATLVLACDHRALYGADGSRFLARVRDLLEDPSWLG